MTKNNMAGMEGYFGPRDISYGYYRSHIDYLSPRNEEAFDSRNPSLRPTDLNINVKHASFLEKAQEEEEEAVRKYVGIGVSLATLITENLLSHPFVVLRRQCQVQYKSRCYHLTPVTLVPVMIHLHQQQGVTTLWKGLGSAVLIRGMGLAIEDLFTKFTTWPKEITSHSSFKSIGEHLLLKSITLAVVTPFYSASLVETVQSDIASEKPGIFDVFREGICRLMSWGSPQKGRMLPVWRLVVPTVTHGLLKYLFGLLVRNVAGRLMRLNHQCAKQKQGAYPKDWLNQNAAQDIEITSTLIAIVTSEVVFYPFETILHRLHLQGTRTIIDNLDSGSEVIPVLTSYEGALECFETACAQEGVSGLYKGFGALMLQFAAHYVVIRLAKWVLTHATIMLRSGSPPLLLPPQSQVPPPSLPNRQPVPQPSSQVTAHSTPLPLRHRALSNASTVAADEKYVSWEHSN